jgi:hypothetical protein
VTTPTMAAISTGVSTRLFMTGSIVHDAIRWMPYDLVALGEAEGE